MDIGRIRQKVDKKELKITSEYINFRDIEESPLNAQEMQPAEFKRLVNNLKRDGVLTTTPLLMRQDGKDKLMCISGHHRIKAAIKAGIQGAICLVTEQLDDSTRVRLQLAHNDIHGEPNQDIVALLQQQLNDIDISLVDSSEIEQKISEANDVEVDVPNFQYINVCLLDTSREKLTELIMSLEKSDAINWLISKPEYDALTDLLSYAFENGFKTPGQAFGKFLEIVEQNINQIKR